MTTISFDVSSFDTEICFSDAIIAGATGDPLNFITGSCIDGNEVSICDDATACNFGELGDCLYADFVCWDDSLVCDESDCPEEPGDAEVYITVWNDLVTFESDSPVGGFDMMLSHGDDFSIVLTDSAFIASCNTTGNVTQLSLIHI